APEDRDHHLQRVLVEVHLVHGAVEARERSLVDPHLLAALERVLRLRLLGRRAHLRQDLLDLVLAERRRLRASPDEPGDLRRVLHDVPRVVGHVHLDQDVPREEPARALHFAPAALLDDVLGRDQDLADLALQPVRLHALLERLLHLVLEPRIGVDDVPVLRDDFGHAAPSRVRIQWMPLESVRSTTQRYSPKKTDTRITTTVVAYTSRRVGHVTRFISLRTSERNVRARSHHAAGRPSTPLSSEPPLRLTGRDGAGAPFTLSSVPVFTGEPLVGVRGQGSGVSVTTR